jgi:hypothetical protein
LRGVPKTFVLLSNRSGDQGIQITGPYETPKGALLDTLAAGIVTERELLDLAKAANLDAAGVSELTARIMKNGAA